MIEWDKGSRRSMSFAATCLSTCRQSHSECQPLHRSKRGHSPRLPTRLLHVQSASSTGSIRLVESAKVPTSAAEAFKSHVPTNVDYAILSYCWGGPQSLMLTRSILESLHDSIPVTQLGQTIQDAITVCNELNIPYLWIDALCILQDSNEDRQHELSMMSTYYQDGVLTICAASAKSSTEGFLSSKEHNEYAVGPFQMTFEEGQKKAFSAGFSTKELQGMAGHPTFNEVQLFKLRDERPTEPIARRAWTFQEAILSTRLLIFASHQVYWCCRERYVGCGGIHSFEKTEVVHPDCPGQQSKRCVCGVSLIRRVNPPDLVPGVFTLGHRNGVSTDTQWDMVVTQFSGRALTNALDKLVAFSAAASYFHSLFRARWPSVQYAAGLWYSDESPLSFIRQLLWSSESPATAYRIPLFRAPTWSWASIDGQVKPFDKLQMYINYHASLVVIKVHTKIAVSTAPFGAINSARLLVRGKLRPLAPSEENGTPPPSQSPVSGLKMLPDTQDDKAFIASNPNQIYLLEVVPYTIRAASPIGIILCRFNGPEETSEGDISTFNRIGTFSFSSERDLGLAADLFNDYAEEEICIL